jgi:hypothetical protein
MYTMTKDGFTLLAMGYTGKEAMQFKVAYINEFNRMEATLRTQARDANEAHEAHEEFSELYYTFCGVMNRFITLSHATDTLCNQINTLNDQMEAHSEKLVAALPHNIAPQITPPRPKQPAIVELINLIAASIDNDAYPYPYQISNDSQQHILIIRLQDALYFIRNMREQFPYKSTTAMRNELMCCGLLVRRHYVMTCSNGSRYPNSTIIDLKSLESLNGGVQ